MFKLKRKLRYLSRFGLRAGLQAARIHAHSESPIQIRLPGFKGPFKVRPGTSDVETFEEVFVTHHYDLPFDDFEPAHILDLGANVGYASIYFAERWPQARILAVEPAANNIALLQQNTQAWPGIWCLQAAVWSHPAQVQVANPTDAPNSYRMSEAPELTGEKISAYPIAQLIERLGCKRLDLLKMDIEGAEAEIFQCDTAWLDQVSVLIVELHDRVVPGCAEKFYRALQGRRFRQEIVGANLAIDLR